MLRIFAIVGILIVVLFVSTVILFQPESARHAYERGLELQQSNQTEAAIRAYQEALRIDENHAETHYELGWSYWVLEDWPKVIEHWEKAKALELKNVKLDDYIQQAKNYSTGKYNKVVRVGIGARAKSTDGSLRLTLVARYQRYNPKPKSEKDFYDEAVLSPKSVQFHPKKNKVYVNALEAEKTLVYDSVDLEKIRQIEHRFDENTSALFKTRQRKRWMKMPCRIKKPNHFSGKPVEQTFSRDGKYLWVPYYRRSFDMYSRYPSALALIDTRTEKIIRVFDTGPIPKYVTTSPNGRWLAVTHWGDNTVGLIKTVGKPGQYRYDRLIVIDKKLKLDNLTTVDRDHNCGFCLRGSVFSKDNRYLFVARMGGGGIAVIDMKRKKYLGSVFGMPLTPRHLLLSPDGKQLYLSSNLHGSVSKYNVGDLIKAVKNKQEELEPLHTTKTGARTRTISITPDGKIIFAAVNRESKIVALRAKDLKYLFHIKADSYPVGMAVAPDGKQLWVTAQGYKGRGGNSVMVYEIHRPRKKKQLVAQNSL